MSKKDERLTPKPAIIKGAKWHSYLIVGGMVAVFAFVVISGAWGSYIGQKGPLAEPTVVNIPMGSSVKRMANLLHEEGVIKKRWPFEATVRIMALQSSLQAGSYEFPAHVSVRQVIGKLSTGEVRQLQVTIPEGQTVSQVIETINAIPELVGEPLAADAFAEGTLLPETYAYTVGETRKAVAERMQRAHRAALATAWDQRIEGLPINSPEELLTLASIVEKETAVAAERAEVAGVFINRLERGMKLEADPTVIYGASDYHGNIRRKHLREDQPYNTYVHAGLPPGPIANPGIDSLLATANPAQTTALFFVADGKGGHVFAETYQEHKRNVQAYLKILREQRNNG